MADPEPTGYLTLPGVKRWTLTVERVDDITPVIRRIVLTSPDLSGFDPLPGQDVMLIFERAGGGRPLHRRYSIRRFDRATRRLELWFVMHGDGPAVTWAAGAAKGDRIDGAGPRGKITIDARARFHLFAGDATFLPAALAMIETLPDDAQSLGIFEAPGVPGASAARLLWESRDAIPLAVLAERPPPADAHAYVAGEIGLVEELRAALEALGFEPAKVSAKPYWRAGRANQAHGEPDRS